MDADRLHACAGVGIAVLWLRLRDLADCRRAAAADPCRAAGAHRGARRARAVRGQKMTIAIDIMLWLVVAALGFIAALRGRVLLNYGARDGAGEFIHRLPRLAIAR